MPLPSPSRRVLGLLAAGTLGVGSAVVGAPGVAAAGTQNTDGIITVPVNMCSASWSLVGASGGTANGRLGGLGGTVDLDTAVRPGDELYVEVGAAGAPGGVAGAGGNGGDGGVGGGAAAGGGGATALYRGGSAAGDLLAVAGGGGGAGTQGPGGAADTAGAGTIYVFGGQPGTATGAGAGGSAANGGAGATDGSAGAGGVGGTGAGLRGGGGGGGLFGGGGGAADNAEGAGGGGGASWADAAVAIGTAVSPGDGFVDFSFAPCAVPDAPELTLVGTEDGAAIVEFWPADVDENAPKSEVTGWEYTVGNGPAQPLVIDSGSGQGMHTATITGLPNGQESVLRVHATSASGDGAPSNPVSATPFVPLGAPGGIRVSTAPAEVSVSWDAPAAGTYAIDGYVAALVLSYEDMGGAVEICETAPQVRTCTVPAQPGLDYTVAVFAVDAEGHEGEMSPLVPVGDVPALPAVPASDGSLVATGGSTSAAVAGEEMTVTGTGFGPFTIVTLLVYSEPQILGTVVTDADGAFTATVTLPAGLAAGKHTIVATGVDSAGNVRHLTLPITVGAGSGPGSGGGGELAYTGASVVVPALGGVAALVAGSGLLVASRRRSAR